MELAAGQKVAAVATSAAIASGGGVAAERLATRAPADADRAKVTAKAPARDGRRHPGASVRWSSPGRPRGQGPIRGEAGPSPGGAGAGGLHAALRCPSPPSSAPAAGVAAARERSRGQAAPAPSQGRGGEFAP